MSNEIEVRKMPKKSIYIMIAIIVLGSIALMATSFSQQIKVEEVLSTLGYKKVKSITIYNKSPVHDDETNTKGELTKIKFTNVNTNQECFGFILKNKKTGKYTKDLDCK